MATSSSAQDAPAGTDILESPVCKHHWVIDAPAGPSSKGMCRLCGEERQFQNYIEGSAWGTNISLDQLSGGSRIPTRNSTREERNQEE